jgi:rRNA maturation RNase YbeY
MAPGDQRPSMRRSTGSGRGEAVEPRRPTRPGVHVTVSDERGRPLSAGLAAWLTRVAPAGARGGVNVALVSDARIRALNRKYRRHDAATDVLSFPAFASTVGTGGSARLANQLPPRLRRSDGDSAKAEEPARRRPAEQGSSQQSPRRPLRPRSDRSSVNSPVSTVQPFLGDIVIARGVARRQARLAGHGEATELRVLALHGLLHLLGYDHERDSGQMARLEHRLRRKAGLRDALIERAAR